MFQYFQLQPADIYIPVGVLYKTIDCVVNASEEVIEERVIRHFLFTYQANVGFFDF